MSPQRHGISFQFEIANILSEAFPCLPSNAITSCDWMERGDDIILSSAAKKLIPFNIECKYDISGNYRAAYQQARRRQGHQPLVILKCNRRHMTPAEKDAIYGAGYAAVSKGDSEARHKPIAVVAGPTLRSMLGDARHDFDIKRVNRCNLYSTFLEQSNLIVVIDSPKGELAAIQLDHFLTYLKHTCPLNGQPGSRCATN